MKKLTLAVLTLTATSAFAAKSNTEYYFRPAGGTSALTATYGMGTAPLKLEPVGGGAETEFKTSYSALVLDYGYGLSETSVVGGYISPTGDVKVESGGTSETGSGLSDPHVYYKGMMGMWYYGADLGVSIAKAKLKTIGAGPGPVLPVMTNRSSGGLSLRANAGLLMSTDALNYGADLSYLYPLERSYELDLPGGGGGKITGGSTLRLAPFVEYNYGFGFVGAELAYHMMDAMTLKPDAGGEAKYKGHSPLSASIFASYDVNDLVTGLFGYSMIMHPAGDFDDPATQKAKAYTESMWNLGARFTF